MNIHILYTRQNSNNKFCFLSVSLFCNEHNPSKIYLLDKMYTHNVVEFGIMLTFYDVFSTIFSLFLTLVCKMIDAASVSSSHDVENNTQSSKATTMLDILKVKHTKRDPQLTDRNRRLIPYMMVYLPTTIRQFAPFANPYVSTI